jgi:hypothetical protein
MSLWNIFIVLALAATIFSLICGVASMVVNGEVRHVTSEQWMWRRVGFQAATAALVLIAVALE